MVVRQASADEAQRLRQRFAKDLIDLRAVPTGQTVKQEVVYVLSAESNLGEKLEVNFFYR